MLYTAQNLKLEVALVMVTFHPDRQVVDRISAALQHGDFIVVVDNGSNSNELNGIRTLSTEYSGRVELIENRQNLGVAAALNIGVRWITDLSRSRPFRWVALLDQDSLLRPEYLTEVASSLNRLAFVHGSSDPAMMKLAVLGVTHFDPDSKLTSDPLRINRISVRNILELPVRTVITSGSLIPLSSWNTIGEMWEALFIDHVDHEYCLRARKLGYHVVQIRKALMTHTIGRSSIHKFLGRTVCSSNHSAFRWFYFVRNYLLVAPKVDWRRDWRWVAREGRSLVYRFFLMCLFEDNRLSKVAFCLRGMLAGFVYWSPFRRFESSWFGPAYISN